MKRLLLHACCAPCSSAVLEKLKQDYDVTVFFYNPNIFPKEEFVKREQEIEKYLLKLNVPLIKVEYDHKNFIDKTKNYEAEKEGGKRCYMCYKMRLEKTLEYALKHNFDYFCTTLSTSPHKNADWLNEIGTALQTDTCKYLVSNFKKQNGYLRSLQISAKENFYRQNYCGCEFSIR